MTLKSFISAAILVLLAAGPCLAEDTIYVGPNVGTNFLVSAPGDSPAGSAATVYGLTGKYLYDKTLGVGLNFQTGKHRDKDEADLVQGNAKINMATLDLYYTLFRLGPRFFLITGSGGKLTGESEATAGGLKTTESVDSAIYGLGFGTFMRTGLNLGFDAKYYFVSDADFGNSIAIFYITLGYSF